MSKHNPTLQFANGSSMSLNMYQQRWNGIGYYLEYLANQPYEFKLFCDLLIAIFEGKKIVGELRKYGEKRRYIGLSTGKPNARLKRFLDAVMYQDEEGRWTTKSHQEAITNFGELTKNREIARRFKRIYEKKPLYLPS